MRSENQISLLRMIKMDVTSSVLFGVFAMWVVLLSITVIFGYEKVKQSAVLFCSFAALVPGGCLVLLFSHYLSTKGKLSTYSAIPARVTRTTNCTNLIEYEYDFEGEVHRGSITCFGATDMARVTAMVNPRKPSESFVKEFFCA